MQDFIFQSNTINCIRILSTSYVVVHIIFAVAQSFTMYLCEVFLNNWLVMLERQKANSNYHQRYPKYLLEKENIAANIIACMRNNVITVLLYLKIIPMAVRFRIDGIHS